MSFKRILHILAQRYAICTSFFRVIMELCLSCVDFKLGIIETPGGLECGLFGCHLLSFGQKSGIIVYAKVNDLGESESFFSLWSSEHTGKKQKRDGNNEHFFHLIKEKLLRLHHSCHYISDSLLFERLSVLKISEFDVFFLQIDSHRSIQAGERKVVIDDGS